MESKMNETQKRKDDHLHINLKKDVSSDIRTGFEQYAFDHCALPELDFGKISTSIKFLGFGLNYPILVSSMTGGTKEGDLINIHLAEAAQELNIAMGVGSQRAAIEGNDKTRGIELRKYAPTIPLFANLGAIQLNYGFSIEECKKAVEMIKADALILHLNSLQEALQQNGQTNFAGLSKKIELVCSKMEIPVIVKEVGWGISAATAKRLVDLGVAVIDVAGAGGTSWSEVEKHRSQDDVHHRISAQFRGWGIPTADAIIQVHDALPNTPIIASGGLKRGMELAKSIALGASLGGFAGALLKPAAISMEKVLEVVDEITLELRLTMFAAGLGNIDALSNNSSIHKV
jgi:isopentenyl-diphosphate delta-isomerase